MSVSEKKKASNAKWDRENMLTLGCRIRKEQAAAFKAVCAAAGTTANTALKEYVMERIGEKTSVGASDGVSASEGILTPETLEQAQEAAERTGEGVTDFISRAVSTQSMRDKASFRMGINPAPKKARTEGAEDATSSGESPIPAREETPSEAAQKAGQGA